MYSEKVLDHFHHPRNLGEIRDATAAIEMTNPVCGDLLRLWAVTQGETIREVKFKIDGCVPAVACASRLTEMMLDKPIGELKRITPQQIESALDGLPPASHHASLLAVDALRALLGKL